MGAATEQAEPHAWANELVRIAPGTYDIPEVAVRLGIGRTLAFDLARRDALPVPVIRLGRRMVVSRAALDRLLAGDATA